MAYTVSVTTSAIYTALRAYLKEFLSLPDEKVRRAYIDNVPLPFPYPFVLVTILGQRRNSTNSYAYDKKSAEGVSASYILDVQLDFYGADSLDLAVLIKNLFRDEFSVNWFEKTGLVPLYADDPMTSGGEDEKGNFMVRHTMTLHFNTSPVVQVKQDYFDAAEIEVKNAEKDV